MLNCIRENNHYCISAHFHDINKNISIYSNLKQTKNRILNQIKNGKNISIYGDITNSGFESYPFISQLQAPFKSGWIPGGCVMHHRKNLILENYFPFVGKAYSEDLFHSIELKKKNIELLYHPKAKAYLNVDNKKISFGDFKNFILDDFKIRQRLVNDNNLNIYRMYVVYVLKFIKYFLV